MKFIKPADIPARLHDPGGYIGTPQSLDWLKEWIENKGRWVLLECEHIEDIGDRSIIVINAFPGCTVLCERCNRFVSVVRSIERRTPPMKYPDEPMF